ncbi:MAG: DUF92 domain-containing protein [Anaerolineae bacterium]|nr:DUF92 domain-containing protein [Anaerolineae bacterium]
MDLSRIVAGLALSAAIGTLGYRRGALAPSGVVGAIIVGTATFGFGGWAWGILVVGFFVSSSALSHWREGQKQALAEKFQKGHRRDLAQALANGGWGVILALAYAIRPGPALYVAFVGTMATVNADTWATELGVLGRSLPRLITTGRPVPVGTSGAISLVGTGAALAGAAFIGFLAAILAWPGAPLPSAIRLLPLAAASGLAGSLADSLLGATVQGIYYCDACGKETEQRVHRCGRTTRRLRGQRWCDNDVVNFLSAAVGGLVAIMLSMLII